MTAQAIAANLATPAGQAWQAAGETSRASARAFRTAVESYVVAGDADLDERRSDLQAAASVARFDFTLYVRAYVAYAQSLREPGR